MELQGKIIVALPERSGTSARGEWKSQSFVVETHDAYPRKMVFDVFGADRLARFNIQVGQEVMSSTEKLLKDLYRLFMQINNMIFLMH